MLQSAADQHRKQQKRAQVAAAGVRRLWRNYIRADDLDGSWNVFAGLALPYLAALQNISADDAIAYLPLVLAEQGIADDPITDVLAVQLIGIASDGRDLDSLLYSPITTAKAGIGDGMSPAQALAAGQRQMQMIAATQVQDAGRVAAGLGITVRPNVGYVRALNLPSCARCVILAGRFYKWNAGFERHPQCDCFHIPSTVVAASGQTVDPTAAFNNGQIRGLSRADQQAIRDGADINQVVNAHRGMAPAQIYGRTLKLTREGTTSRGLAGQRLGNLERRRGRFYRTSRTPRLMPESIYKIAGDDRTEALRLLRQHGYVL